MKTIIFILLVSISTATFSSDHEYWRKPQYKTLTQQNYERELKKDYRMNQALQRELRETGRIAPKDYLDVYNMREGYGYDGGYVREPYNMYGR